MKEIILLVPVLAGAVALPGAGFAQTDNYPNKPIRLVAPFPPGGSVDIVGRDRRRQAFPIGGAAGRRRQSQR